MDKAMTWFVALTACQDRGGLEALGLALVWVLVVLGGSRKMCRERWWKNCGMSFSFCVATYMQPQAAQKAQGG